jgi:hypothetical protein
LPKARVQMAAQQPVLHCPRAVLSSSTNGSAAGLATSSLPRPRPCSLTSAPTPRAATSLRHLHPRVSCHP